VVLQICNQQKHAFTSQYIALNWKHILSAMMTRDAHQPFSVLNCAQCNTTGAPSTASAGSRRCLQCLMYSWGSRRHTVSPPGQLRTNLVKFCLNQSSLLFCALMLVQHTRPAAATVCQNARKLVHVTRN
jgi:hypothetical protein